MRFDKLIANHISTLTSDYFTLHSKFVTEAWGENSIRKNYEYLAWKFRSNKTDEIENVLIYHDENNNVLGQIGMIPAKMVVENKIYDCYWGCNFKVLKQYEEVGIGALLYLAARKKVGVSIGSNPSLQSYKIVKKLKSVETQGPKIFIMPVTFDHITSLKISKKNFIFFNLVKMIFTCYINFRKLFWKVFTKRETRIEKYPFDTAIIEEHRKSIELPHILHDADFFNWRIREFKTYRKAASLIYSLDEKSFACFSVSKPYLMINEFKFNSVSDAISILNELVIQAQNEGAATIKILANYPDEEKLLGKLGFIGFSERIKILYFLNEVEFPEIEKMHFDGYDGDYGL